MARRSVLIDEKIGKAITQSGKSYEEILKFIIEDSNADKE